MERFSESPQALQENLNLPYSLEAEQSVLGAILIDAGCLTRVMEYIKPDSFFKEQNREIFSAMIRLFTSGQPVDFITVLEEILSENVFDNPDNAKFYLTQLAQLVPSLSNVEVYARIVQEKYYVRSLILASREIMEVAQSGGEEARTLLDMAEQKIFDIRQGRDARGLKRIDEILIETYDRLQKLSGEDRDQFMGLPSGFPDLDRVISGLNKSDLIIVAGRPGMGKTSFGLNIAEHVAVKTKKKVAVFSLEMSGEQLVSRVLSSVASIGSHQLKTGELKANDWVELAAAADLLSQSPFYIDDTSGINAAEMKAKLRRVKDLGLVVIDYLQLMSSQRPNNNRVQEVSEITRSLKIMAKELNVPVIVCSQLARGPESRTDHRPMLSDLRESGSIEQDADIVLFLYRDAYYNRDSQEVNIAECIVAKNRHGETATVKMGWDGQFTRFQPLETRYEN